MSSRTTANIDRSLPSLSTVTTEDQHIRGVRGLNLRPPNTGVVLNYREKTPINSEVVIPELDTDQLMAQLQRSEAIIQSMRQQIHHLSSQLETANQRTVTAQTLNSKLQPRKRQRHEPSWQASTYVVPKRRRSIRIDRLLTAAPFSVLMMSFSVGLAAAFMLAMPALTLSLSPTIILSIRILFLTIAITTIGSLVFEICRYHPV
jgi:hypothetical protein